MKDQLLYNVIICYTMNITKCIKIFPTRILFQNSCAEYGKIQTLKAHISPFSTHPTSIIDNTSKIGNNCSIGPFVYIGPHVTIGNDVKIESHCSLTNCDIGDRIIIQNGVCIGQDGIRTIPTTWRYMSEKDAPKLRVIIKNDVVIGANSIIDRGSWCNTNLSTFTKFSNFLYHPYLQIPEQK